MRQVPQVSVVITTYNQAPYIGPALESVFAQTLQPDEVVVVDDGSTDETAERIAPFRDRIVYLRQSNQGVAEARNSGIRRARGEFLAFLDGDDLWEPEKLALQVAAACKHSTSGLIVVDGVQFSAAGILRESMFSTPIANLFNGGEETISIDASPYFLRENMIWTTSQVMIPASVFDTVGLSDPQLALVSDWDLYLRIAERYPVTFVPRRLMRWRYHEASASGPAVLRELRWGEDGLRMLAKHLRQASGDRRRIVRAALRSQVFMLTQAAYYRAEAGQRELGLRYLWRFLPWSRVSAAPLAFLLAAYSPAWLNRWLGRVARTVLKVSRSA